VHSMVLFALLHRPRQLWINEKFLSVPSILFGTAMTSRVTLAKTRIPSTTLLRPTA